MYFLEDNLSTNLKRTAKGSLTLALSQVISTIFLAIGMLFVARWLGSSKWGLLSIANSVVNIAQLFQDIGVRDSLIRYISQNKHEGKQGNVKVFIEAGLILSLCAALLLVVVLFLLSDYIAIKLYNEPELGFYIRLLSIALIGRAFLFTSYGVTVGYERMRLRGLLRIIYTFLKSVVSPFLVVFGFGILGGILGEVGPILLTGGLGLAIIWSLYRQENDMKKDVSRREALKIILTFGGPIYIANLIMSIRPQLLTFLLGFFMGEEIAGNWTVVLWFSSLLAFVNLPIRTTLFPLLSKSNEKKELEFIYLNSIKFSSLLTYPIALSVMALSDQIILGLFGGDYVYASQFLSLYMITFLFSIIGSNSNAPLLKSQKFTTEIVLVQLVQFLVTFAPALYVIPRFGATGAIGLFLLGVATSKAYSCWLINRIFGYKIDIVSSGKIIVSGLGSYFSTSYLVYSLHLSPWWEILIGGIVFVSVYMVLLTLFKTLNKDDRRRLRKLGPMFGPFSPLFTRLVDILTS